MRRLLRRPLAPLREAVRLLWHQALPPWGSRPRYPYEHYWTVPTEAAAREAILTGHSFEDEFEAAGQKWAERIKVLVSDPSSVLLDFGCGIGRVTKYLTGYSRVYGVDVSKRMLAFARQRVSDSHVTFLKTNGRRVPVPDHSIDFLFSLLVLQHVDRRDVGHLMREFRRVLKPAGRCYLQFPEYGDTVDRGVHTWPWTVEAVQALFREWSILSLEREAGPSGFVNILVLAQPRETPGSACEITQSVDRVHPGVSDIGPTLDRSRLSCCMVPSVPYHTKPFQRRGPPLPKPS